MPIIIRTDLEDVPPVLALVVQPLVQHLHHLDKLVLRIRHLRNLVHLRPGWTPWIVRGRSSDLDLGVGVAFGVVFGDSDGASAATGREIQVITRARLAGVDG